MTRTKHSVDHLKKLQRILEESVSDKRGVTGVGIGLNDARTDYVLRVLVESDKDAEGLPSRVEDVEVLHQVTGRVRSL